MADAFQAEKGENDQKDHPTKGDLETNQSPGEDCQQAQPKRGGQALVMFTFYESRPGGD